MILLRGKNTPTVEEAAEKIYADLLAAGFEVLYDEREESPGIKFNDADLIGLPIRLTVSERALAQGGVEMKMRNKTEKDIIPLNEIIVRLQSELVALYAALASKVVPVEYNKSD